MTAALTGAGNEGVMKLQFIDDLIALSEIVEQLKACEFECEGGYLKNNVEFIRLEEIASRWESATAQAEPPEDAA